MKEACITEEDFRRKMRWMIGGWAFAIGLMFAGCVLMERGFIKSGKAIFTIGPIIFFGIGIRMD